MFKDFVIFCLLVLVIGGTALGLALYGSHKDDEDNGPRMTVSTSKSTASREAGESDVDFITSSCSSELKGEYSSDMLRDQGLLFCTSYGGMSLTDASGQGLSYMATLYKDVSGEPTDLAVYRQSRDFDLRVPTKRISGSFYTLSLHNGLDMWSYGFGTAGQLNAVVAEMETKSEMEQFEEMIQNMSSNGYLLLGESFPSTSQTPLFTFSTDEDTLYTMNIPPETMKFDPVTGGRLAGFLRMAADVVQYDYDLDGKPFSFRVRLGGSVDGAQMGDKQLFVDGAWRWLDIAEKPYKWVSERKDAVKALSFWNQPREDEGGGPSEEDMEEEAKFASAVIAAADRIRLPMTVALQQDVDLLGLGVSNYTLRFLVANEVQFRDAKTKGWTEADLAVNPINQILHFDMPDINLHATLSANLDSF